ncbi:hypothetical protein CDAR_544431 [Caerostris darwini]|uniref:Uncharacterized protein n=1 Tax=Caerostris darwini TaxID=1538125 RepID=A0AAV4THI7_9ARAC|nr:hypothetical protein CDAR_544431 [Caerostris darwini]
MICNNPNAYPVKPPTGCGGVEKLDSKVLDSNHTDGRTSLTERMVIISEESGSKPVPEMLVPFHAMLSPLAQKGEQKENPNSLGI